MAPPLIPDVLHPVLVHFPIVLLPLAAIAASVGGRAPWARRALPWLLAAAAVAAPITAALGLAEHEAIEPRLTEEGRQWLDMHEMLGLTVGVATPLLGIAMLVARRKWTDPHLMLVWSTALWGLTALVYLASWYGGAITFEGGLWARA